MRQSIEAVLGPWSEGPGPLHRKLSDALRAAIADGRLGPGHRLPSERDLAGRLAVSRSTVVAAYDTLRAEAVIESRQGSGTRVHGTAANGGAPGAVALSPVYRTLVNGRHDLISLAAAAFPAHPQVAVATAEVLGEDGDKLLAHTGYLPAGLPALREALADRLTMLGSPTTADQVLVTACWAPVVAST